MKFGYGGFLEDDEQVLKVFRRPLVFLAKPLCLRVLFWGTLVFLWWFFYPAYFYEKKVWFDLNYVWQALALVGFINCMMPTFFWYMNAIVMTNESIIIIDWPRFFVRRSSRIDFHNLDEVTVERVGVRSFLFNYGNIIFGKVNGGDQHLVPRISRPSRAARIIENYREWHLDQKNFTEESALKGLLSGMVQRHVGDKGQPERSKDDKKYITNPVIQEAEDTETIVVRKPKSHHSKPVRTNVDDVQVEKELDDTGGIDIDLED